MSLLLKEYYETSLCFTVISDCCCVFKDEMGQLRRLRRNMWARDKVFVDGYVNKRGK
jgi:hypothetical protein